LSVRGAEEGGEKAGFEEHGFPSEAEEFLAYIDDGEIEDVEEEPGGDGEPDGTEVGESDEGKDGEHKAGPGDEVEKAVRVAPMEDAGGFALGGVAEIVRNGKEAGFTEERFELAYDGEEGYQVDRGHAALDEQAGEPEVAEIEV